MKKFGLLLLIVVFCLGFLLNGNRFGTNSYAQEVEQVPPRPTPPGGLPPNPYDTPIPQPTTAPQPTTGPGPGPENPTPIPGPGPQPSGKKGSGARRNPKIAVTLTATPNIWVRRGDTITYQFQVRNIGSVRVWQTDIYFPYHPDYLTIDAIQTEGGDRIKSQGVGYVILQVGGLDPATARTIHITARVADSVPDGTVLWGQASHTSAIDISQDLSPGIPAGPVTDYRMSLRKPAIGIQSNSVPVLVGETNESSSFVWMAVSPEVGNARTSYTFLSDRFMPGERVAVWLNLSSDQVKGLPMQVVANEQGLITVVLPGRYCPGGTCQLVALGTLSGLQAVTPFQVTNQ